MLASQFTKPPEMMMLQQAQNNGAKPLNYEALVLENKRPPTRTVPVGFRSQPASAAAVDAPVNEVQRPMRAAFAEERAEGRCSMPKSN